MLTVVPCRAMGFVAGLLRRLFDDRQVTMATAASDVYTDTLYQYHGWITSAAFTVALKVSNKLRTAPDIINKSAIAQPHCIMYLKLLITPEVLKICCTVGAQQASLPGAAWNAQRGALSADGFLSGCFSASARGRTCLFGAKQA